MRRSTSSFKLPAEIEQKMNQKLVSDGYGLRGKSKWICDAIKSFLSNEDAFCLECIQYADELENLNKSVSFRPTDDVDQLLNKWIIKARQHMPLLEGVKSKIIRASIIQGLLVAAF